MGRHAVCGREGQSAVQKGSRAAQARVRQADHAAFVQVVAGDVPTGRGSPGCGGEHRTGKSSLLGIRSIPWGHVECLCLPTVTFFCPDSLKTLFCVPA